MATITRHFPPGVLGVVAPHEFGAMLQLAERAYRLQPQHRYVAGVLATLRWVFGVRHLDPIDDHELPATPANQLAVRVRAGATVMGNTQVGRADVHPDWARGVERTLTWLRGPRAGGPAPPPLP